MIKNPQDFYEQFQNFIEEVTNQLFRLVKRKGSNGIVSNFETVGTVSEVGANSPNASEADASLFVLDGEVGTAWRKVVRANSELTVSLGGSWTWENGVTPSIKTGDFLIFNWCGRSGIASILKK